MRIIFGSISSRLLLSAVALSGATLLVAVGCGGGSSGSGSSGGTGGSSGDTGGDTTGGTSEGGTKAGSGNTGGDTTMTGEGGEAGAAVELPPAKNHSAVSFVGGGAISSSKHFTLIGAVGESFGGTGKISKSAKHSYIPGVIAAASP